MRTWRKSRKSVTFWAHFKSIRPDPSHFTSRHGFPVTRGPQSKRRLAGFGLEHERWRAFPGTLGRGRANANKAGLRRPRRTPPSTDQFSPGEARGSLPWSRPSPPSLAARRAGKVHAATVCGPLPDCKCKVSLTGRSSSDIIRSLPAGHSRPPRGHRPARCLSAGSPPSCPAAAMDA